MDGLKTSSVPADNRAAYGFVKVYMTTKGTGVLGNRLTVYFQFHTPRVHGTLHIPTGIQIKFTYLKQQSQFVLKNIEDVHF
jgi:hypothetical protein